MMAIKSLSIFVSNLFGALVGLIPGKWAETAPSSGHLINSSVGRPWTETPLSTGSRSDESTSTGENVISRPARRLTIRELRYYRSCSATRREEANGSRRASAPVSALLFPVFLFFFLSANLSPWNNCWVFRYLWSSILACTTNKALRILLWSPTQYSELLSKASQGHQN